MANQGEGLSAGFDVKLDSPAASPIAYVAENREVCDVQYRKVAAGLT